MRPQRERMRRKNRRAFLPGLGGELESRCLLSSGKVSGKVSAEVTTRRFHVTVQVGNHGKIAEVFDQQGQKFDIILTGPGVVIASPMPNNQVKIVVNGTNQASTLEIDPTQLKPVLHGAHSFPTFPTPSSQQSGVLNVGELDVTTGNIFDILAYRTANLTGPLTVLGTNPVDRIALNAVQPGASIRVGTPPPAVGASGQGDLDTLDVFTNVTLTSGPGIIVGRDLNGIQVGGTLTLENGANVLVGRYVGLTPNLPKGTDLGVTGGLIQGDLVIGPGSEFATGSAILNNVIVYGFASAATRSRFIIPAGSPRGLVVLSDSV